MKAVRLLGGAMMIAMLACSGARPSGGPARAWQAPAGPAPAPTATAASDEAESSETKAEEVAAATEPKASPLAAIMRVEGGTLAGELGEVLAMDAAAFAERFPDAKKDGKSLRVDLRQRDAETGKVRLSVVYGPTGAYERVEIDFRNELRPQVEAVLTDVYGEPKPIKLCAKPSGRCELALGVMQADDVMRFPAEGVELSVWKASPFAVTVRFSKKPSPPDTFVTLH